MSAVRVRTIRSVGFVSALLLTTAISVPAMAIEEVVVTAQKTSQDIQTVPIAISAFTANDLAAHQIAGFKDLQFSIPSVTFTHGNFGPSNFQIRGIGSAAVTTSGDAGVSVNTDEIYIAGGTPLTSASYFDVERIEVLRGPQSTLFGRNATGGAINIITNKPDLSEFHADMEATYGNYNYGSIKAMVNIPIVTDELGVRLAGFWENRDGTIENVYHAINHSADANVDGRNDYAIRGSVRWEPSQKTTVDLIVSVSHEHDSRVRAQKQLCHRDPSGILGCLPDKLASEGINANATLGTLLASNIGPLGGFDPTNPANIPYGGFTASGGFPIFDVADPTNGFFPGLGAPGLGASAVVPASLRQVSTDFNPFTTGFNRFGTLQWHQQIFPWLSSDFLLGYNWNTGRSQESYNNGVGDSFSSIGPTLVQTLFGFGAPFYPLGQTSSLGISEAAYCAFIAAPTNCALLTAGGIGSLPVDGVGGNGTVGGNIYKYSNRNFAYDQIDGSNREWTAELRFRSNFQGPFNFLIGGYHLENRNDAHYFVNANTLDLAGIMFGGFAADGFALSPFQYDNENTKYQLHSNAVFGEVYYDMIPDTLKFTAGLRYTDDSKSFISRQTLLNEYVPLGTTSIGVGYTSQKTKFSAWTGRFVADWTPDLDWTEQTLIYASYARGFRSGGFNPPSSTGAFPPTFDPETVDAIEVGTKNTLPLWAGTLQANMDVWYYDYKGYQVSAIIDRTSVNSNIDAKLWGVEGQFFWAPDEHWQFNLNTGFTHSAIGNVSQVDPRNPTQNASYATLLKDAQGANCSIINTAGAAPTALTSADFYAMFATPPTGSGVSSPIPGVAAQAYFLQNNYTCAGLSAQDMLFQAGGLGAITDPHVAAIYAAGYRYQFGVPVSLSGNQMPNTPEWTISIGAQYTFNLDGGYTLVPRVDYYWKSDQFGRIFNGPADKIKAWDVMNAQIQLNSPDAMWYARAWVQNLMDKDNITGMYITDPSSALFTNVFVGTPRTYGITIGAHL